LERKKNLKNLEELYQKLGISQKVGTFEELFAFKAVNLSGISLADENLGEVKEGKYAQIIAIIYDKNAKVKNKNVSLAYYGRTEKLSPSLKNEIVAFVLGWRFEKSFRTLEHYHNLMSQMRKSGDE
jgi:hypothetical protein